MCTQVKLNPLPSCRDVLGLSILCILGIIAFLSAIGEASASTPDSDHDIRTDQYRSAETLAIALNTDIRSTQPGVNRDANTDAVMHQMVESLVAYSEDLSIKPVVAESFSRGEGGKIYEFKIRKGLKFHNGAAVTSAEVKWSWMRYLDPATQWKCTHWFIQSGDDGSGESSIITSIETPDEETIVFKLLEPSSLFLDRMANVQCISAVLHPDSVDENGDWLKPIGTGPYQMKRWQRGEYVELERFDGYKELEGGVDGLAGRKKTIAKSVRFLISPDAASTKAALLSDQIDIFQNIPLAGVEDFESAEGIRLVQSPTLSWTVLLLQTRDPVLKAVLIRRAIATAIDRQLVADFNAHGYSSVNSSAVPVGVASHTPKHDDWYAANKEKASELLKQAGYHGQPIRIQTNRKYQEMYTNAIVIQAMLQAAGINAQIEVLDWASQLANYYSGKFQLSSFSYSPLVNPALRYYKLIGLKESCPVCQWEDPRALELLDQAINSFSEPEQSRAYEALHELMKDDVPIIGLYNAHSASAVGEDVRGFQPWPLNLPRLWGVWKTSWRKNE